MNARVNYRLWGLCLIASACASTTMSSLVAPELGGRSFHFVLVIAAFSDVGVMRATEDRFASASGKEVRFVQSYGVFFPGRNYTHEETADLLHERGIDAVLVVSPEQAGAVSYYQPPTYMTACTAWSPETGCARSVTTPIGGATYAKPWAVFGARLYDVNTGVPVWVATAHTKGNEWATDRTLVESLADKTVGRLDEEGVVAFCSEAVTVRRAEEQLQADSDSVAWFTKSVADAGSIHYASGASATPEQRRETQARNDSLSHLKAVGDSIIGTFRARVSIDRRAVATAKQSVVAHCQHPSR